MQNDAQVVAQHGPPKSWTFQQKQFGYFTKPMWDKQNSTNWWSTQTSGNSMTSNFFASMTSWYCSLNGLNHWFDWCVWLTTLVSLTRLPWHCYAILPCWSDFTYSHIPFFLPSHVMLERGSWHMHDSDFHCGFLSLSNCILIMINFILIVNNLKRLRVNSSGFQFLSKYPWACGVYIPIESLFCLTIHCDIIMLKRQHSEHVLDKLSSITGILFTALSIWPYHSINYCIGYVLRVHWSLHLTTHKTHQCKSTCHLTCRSTQKQIKEHETLHIEKALSYPFAPEYWLSRTLL